MFTTIGVPYREFLAKAERELARAAHFDVVIVNDDLDEACAELDRVAEAFLGPENTDT